MMRKPQARRDRCIFSFKLQDMADHICLRSSTRELMAASENDLPGFEEMERGPLPKAVYYLHS